MNQSKLQKDYEKNDGGKIDIARRNSNSSSSSKNKDQLNDDETTTNSKFLNSNVNVKRKSLILCDIKDSSNDNDSFDNDNIIFINNSKNYDHKHDTVTINNDDDDADDDDDEDIFVDANADNCETIEIYKNIKINNLNTTHHSLNKNLNGKTFQLGGNCSHRINQIEYDSQGEEEGCVDSSMESAIEIKDCIEQQEQNINNKLKQQSTSASKSSKNLKNLNNICQRNDKNTKKLNKNYHDTDSSDYDHIDDDHDDVDGKLYNNKNKNKIKKSVCKNSSGNDSDTIMKSANDLICNCSSRDSCITLKDILSAFNAPISEEQAWALIFQTVKLYRNAITEAISNGLRCCKVNVPHGLENLNIHLDGTIHINRRLINFDGDNSAVTSHKKILHKIGHVIFLALDYNLPEDEDCMMSPQLEHLISQMTAVEDIDDEGIERDSEDCEDLDYVIEACIPRVKPSVPEDHYKAVCRAFATEAQDLRTFLQKVFHGDTQALRIKADAVDSNQELDRLGFNDWARFWMQVVDELRHGVRLKRRDFRDVTRTPVEYELTPYEILMEDIRAKKYNLKKVMVNGDIPPRVKKDAHAVILEFIRSRPPLKKASERQLPPPLKRNPSPREQLMDSIRQGRPLKPVPQPTLKNRLLPSTSQQHESLRRDEKLSSLSKSTSISSSSAAPNHISSSLSSNQTAAGSGKSNTSTPKSSKLDSSYKMHDSYSNMDEATRPNINQSHQQQQQQQQQQQLLQQQCNFSQPKMPAYPIAGYATSKDSSTSSSKTVIRRTTYDLATQCESRRASMRRHTIVGCQSVPHNETQSVPPSRPDSRQSNCQQTARYQNQNITPSLSIAAAGSGYSSNALKYQTKSNQSGEPTPTISTTNLSNLSESYTKNKETSETNTQWSDKSSSDRLSLTLEEIVHIRSVMTKAELEGLPVGVRVKEEVEKRKICFLCLRTRFTIFVWGIQCKLCQRTVCSKCYSKMRIPTEHFRNVPVVLLSPSLIGSPASSSAASPCHHGSISHPNSSIDENFPKTLMERLMRSESNRKARNSVGSAPASPKNQRSNMSTPGVSGGQNVNDIMTKSSDSHTLSSSYNKENNGTMLINGGIAANRQVAGIMSRSMEGPRSLPMQSPGRAHSTCSTLERKNRFARALTLSSSSHGAVDLKENLRGEMMAVCNDCRDLVLEIIRSSRQTRSSARNQAIKNLTLDISPVYK